MKQQKVAQLVELLEAAGPDTINAMVDGIKNCIIQSAVSSPTDKIDAAALKDDMVQAKLAADLLERVVVVFES